MEGFFSVSPPLSEVLHLSREHRPQLLWVSSSTAEVLCPTRSVTRLCVSGWGGYLGWQQHVESQRLVERLTADLAPSECVCSSLCRLAGCPGSFNFNLTAFSDAVSSESELFKMSRTHEALSAPCWATNRADSQPEIILSK